MLSKLGGTECKGVEEYLTGLRKTLAAIVRVLLAALAAPPDLPLTHLLVLVMVASRGVAAGHT